MKITVLAENTSARSDLGSEHGLSLYIEANGKKILFDMGQSTLFADNAKILGVDLRDVDLAVLSHGHYDHGGGLLHFLSLNSKAAVYVSPNAFGDYYNADGKYIGLDKSILETDRLVMPRAEDVFIDDYISLISLNRAISEDSVDSAGLTEETDGVNHPDKFYHEQYLVIEENGKRYAFSGCAHKGVVNIAKALKPTVFVGGFHLSKIPACGEGSKRLDAVAAELDSLNADFYTCHCTGVEQYEYLKKLMPHNLHYISTGDIIEV